MLGDLDLLRHVAVEERGLARKRLAGPEGGVVAGEDSVGAGELPERVDDRCACRLQPCAHQLHHEPPVVPVADERRDRIALTVDQTVGICHRGDGASPVDRATECPMPPCGVDARLGIGVQKAERDL